VLDWSTECEADVLLNELINYSELLQMRSLGYVREQSHPEYPSLRILNYTEKAQFDQVWNEVTLTCRGLIYDANTGEIVARAFRKFFNYDHKDTPTINLDDEVVVMDKMDGSLGILYRVPGTERFAVATRGSFDSDQARHATKLLNEKYAEWLDTNVAALHLVTPLFEIVYPENRIVCDYSGMDDLILLGAEVLNTSNGLVQWRKFSTTRPSVKPSLPSLVLALKALWSSIRRLTFV
jgi:RNA ligase